MTAVQDAPAPVYDRYEAGDFDGVIIVPDDTGDAKIMWNRGNADEIAIARAAFDTATGRKSMIYAAVGEEGLRGEKVTTFDETAERLIVVPQIVGG